jgi:hypothetical protein
MLCLKADKLPYRSGTTSKEKPTTEQHKEHHTVLYIATQIEVNRRASTVVTRRSSIPDVLGTNLGPGVGYPDWPYIGHDHFLPNPFVLIMT